MSLEFSSNELVFPSDFLRFLDNESLIYAWPTRRYEIGGKFPKIWITGSNFRNKS